MNDKIGAEKLSEKLNGILEGKLIPENIINEAVDNRLAIAFISNVSGAYYLNIVGVIAIKKLLVDTSPIYITGDGIVQICESIRCPHQNKILDRAIDVSVTRHNIEKYWNIHTTKVPFCVFMVLYKTGKLFCMGIVFKIEVNDTDQCPVTGQSREHL